MGATGKPPKTRTLHLNKVKARSSTKVAVTTNEYATDKRTAAAVNSDLYY